MANANWKRTERAIARRLNATRQGAVGRRGPDVTTSWLALEIKHRRRLPQWLKDALAQAKSGADEQRLAIVVLHESGQRHADDLVVLRLGDFQDWFGEVMGDKED